MKKQTIATASYSQYKVGCEEIGPKGEPGVLLKYIYHYYSSLLVVTNLTDPLFNVSD